MKHSIEPICIFHISFPIRLRIIICQIRGCIFIYVRPHSNAYIRCRRRASSFPSIESNTTHIRLIMNSCARPFGRSLTRYWHHFVCVLSCVTIRECLHMVHTQSVVHSDRMNANIQIRLVLCWLCSIYYMWQFQFSDAVVSGRIYILMVKLVLSWVCFVYVYRKVVANGIQPHVTRVV